VGELLAARPALVVDNDLREEHVMLGVVHLGCAFIQRAVGDRSVTLPLLSGSTSTRSSSIVASCGLNRLSG
jgi:hypothetical protein